MLPWFIKIIHGRFFRNDFVSLIYEKQLTQIPVSKHRWPSIHKPLRIPLPAWWFHSPGKNARCPDLPSVVPQTALSLSTSFPVAARKTKPHVMGKQATRVYSNCSEINTNMYLINKHCFAWQPAYVSIYRWIVSIFKCHRVMCVSHIFYIPLFQ